MHQNKHASRRVCAFLFISTLYNFASEDELLRSCQPRVAKCAVTQLYTQSSAMLVSGSGGGFSKLSDRTIHASWQAQAVGGYLGKATKGMLPPPSAFDAAGRGTPDVSALGEGFSVIVGGQVRPTGGTSASAPTVA